MPTLTQISAAAPELRELYKQALMARDRSHSPYSGHKVGAAIRTAQGMVFAGCNVENSSYGGTVCAERVAVWKAVSELGPLEIKEVMVVTAANPPWPPCGFCRQVLSEFGKEMVIHAANLQGEVQTTAFSQLLPQAFTPDHLLKK